MGLATALDENDRGGQSYIKKNCSLISMQFVLVFLVAFLAFASAYCPNGCSGHGSCGVNEKCNCYNRIDGEPAWTDADCSARTCPK
jgi:hypothetical protein